MCLFIIHTPPAACRQPMLSGHRLHNTSFFSFSFFAQVHFRQCLLTSLHFVLYITLLYLSTLFLFFILDICQPAINFGITRYISQNCGVSDCAVSAICQLICYWVVFNAVIFDGYCSAHCLRLASLKKIISLHKNHLSDCHLIADCLFPLVPACSHFSI